MVEEFWKASRRKFKMPWIGITRNLYFKDTAVEDSEGSEEHIIGNWGRKSSLCNDRNLAKLSPAVVLKKEVISNELRYSISKISKQSVESATWFCVVFFFLIIKCKRRERNQGKSSWNIEQKGTKNYWFWRKKNHCLQKENMLKFILRATCSREKAEIIT